MQIPYSGKVWWGERLANLAKLAKLQVIRQIKPSKLSIQNSSVAISARRQCESSIFAKLSFAKTSRCPIRQTFPPPNLPAIRYTCYSHWHVEVVIPSIGPKVLKTPSLFFTSNFQSSNNTVQLHLRNVKNYNWSMFFFFLQPS